MEELRHQDFVILSFNMVFFVVYVILFIVFMLASCLPDSVEYKSAFSKSYLAATDFELDDFSLSNVDVFKLHALGNWHISSIANCSISTSSYSSRSPDTKLAVNVLEWFLELVLADVLAS